MRVTDGNITVPLTGNGTVSQSLLGTASEIIVGGLNSSLYESIGAEIVTADGKPYAYEYENQLYSESEMAEIYTNLLKSTGGSGVAPKYKTGDVVYCTNVPNFHFGVMTWEDYKRNPTNSRDTKMPIGLVVDPIKRTFLFCELLDKYFATSDNIETYFGGYTSFEDGAETFERIAKLKGKSKAVDIPAFYGIRNSGYSSGSIFYVKNDAAYIPAIEEWKKAKEHLCTAFYGDDGSYAGFMDRLIALKNGTTPSSSLFIGIHPSNAPKLFYSQLSTVGKTVFSDGTFKSTAFNMNGEVPAWNNATDQSACCPVFGIYTEEEENA